MTTAFQAPDDWDANDAKEEAEDLGALGMSIKDADKLDTVEDEDEDAVATPVVVAAVEEDEPKDGLAMLEVLEKELDEPEVDMGEEEDDG